ncbi:MAG TPA: hypothetical protein VF857_03455 [Spirochaetota bacterium]
MKVANHVSEGFDGQMKELEISTLAVDIRNLLSEVVSGQLPPNNAGSKISDLEGRYKALEKELVPLDQRNALGGLCYYHNIENFSIFTGIYEFDGHTPNHAASHGNRKLDPFIRELLNKNFGQIAEKKYLKIEPGEGSLITTLHLYPFKQSQTSLYVVTTLSSSPYFDQKKFIYFGNFLNTLFPDDAKCIHGITDIFRSIENYIGHNVDQFDLYAQLYCFHDIDTIFSHAGTQTLFDVSAAIEKQISDHWGEHLHRFTISLKEYVILIAKEKGSPVHEGNRKMDFYYKSIPLPHSSRFIRLEGLGAYYQLTENLFELSGQ